MRCPNCGATETRVSDTTSDPFRSEIRRRRTCQTCGERFTTLERIRMEMPLIVKEGPDGLPIRREPYDRDKVRRGILIACAKRPISRAAVDRLIDTVEEELRQSGRDEIASHEVGELVIAGLRELDEIAYIRYAIVFLGLEDLTAVRQEIDRLFAEQGARSTLDL
ncbi:MAG: transcriptional repressor NrdR [Chloroflexi bacterium]|nr:transcriptional repressor NrdR [Chloroflexota bacterium]